MLNFTEVKPYEGTGKEYGKVVTTVLNEFKKRGEECRNNHVCGGNIFPRTIFLNEEEGFMVLEASDCVVGESGRNYGHRVFLNFDKPNSLESNFSNRIVKIRTRWGAKREIRRLVNQYENTDWKDLAPRRSQIR